MMNCVVKEGICSMSEHHASVTVNAPVHQVYTLFTHFNDFPKFMSFVKEVTYYDDQRSHWVAHIVRDHEWDAVNEEWIPDQQVGWRSIRGLQNTGKVKFSPNGPNRTTIDVYINYLPPAGVVGEFADKLGIDSHFDAVLQQDLNNFAHMVEHAPPGALDPMQSHYLFHSDSAVARGMVTDQQQVSMHNDPMMQPETLKEREERIQDEALAQQQAAQERKAVQEQQISQQRQAAMQQEEILRRQAERDRQAALEQQAAQTANPPEEREPHPVYDTLGGRNAAMERTVLGDRDARVERFSNYQESPMMSRVPTQDQDATTPVTDIEIESPWSAVRQSKVPESEEEREES
jgi:uncharacterized membrane protein